MHYKKLLILFFLFILTLSFKGTVFSAKINCQTYKNTCPDESLIPQIKKSCGSSILDSVYATCAKEKSEIEKEKKDVDLYLSNLNYEIKDINAEIINAESSLDDIDKALSKINKALNQQKGTLSVALRQIYEYDTNSYIEIFLGNKSLAEFSNKIAEVEDIQKRLGYSVRGVRELKEKLEKKKAERFKYRQVQEISRQNLAIKRDQQQYLLSQLKSEIKELKAAMGKIQSYLTFWSTGDLSWSGIFTTVNTASKLTKVRPALLLGTLRAESVYGNYLSSCPGGYKKCMNATEKNYFEEITKRLCNAYGSTGKFNYCKPEILPVSYGAAMGFAQFIPSTWELDIYKCQSSVKSTFPGKVPNPYMFNHAMVAMASYLGNAGARNSKNERGAIRAYNKDSKYIENVLEYTRQWQSLIDVCGLDLNCPKMREKLEGSGIPLR
ncbi:MAG: hypothetical protein PHI88_01310 [Candidatus Pacebacteria bacterium]|nr:hypothetical protein [Candidatus Paceibacterota bacterium]